MQELTAKLAVEGLPVLRYSKRHVQEKLLDIGYMCIVGDKALRIYGSNRVEISDLEYLEREETGEGELMVQYAERPTWVTQFPEALDLEEVKASLDYAFIHAGLPSLFYLTNLSLARFGSREEERNASLLAYKVLYPEGQPWITELNGILEQFAQDLKAFDALSDA